MVEWWGDQILQLIFVLGQKDKNCIWRLDDVEKRSKM
jgi:hypothetical protein